MSNIWYRALYSFAMLLTDASVFAGVGTRELYLVSPVIRAELDGSNPELIRPEDIHCRFIDLAGSSFAGAVYWVEDCTLDSGPRLYRRRPGGPIELVLALDDFVVASLHIDDASKKMYYGVTNVDASTQMLVAEIRRSELDGTLGETLVAGVSGYVVGIDVDLAAGKVYWASFASVDGLYESLIETIGIDGSQRTVVVSGAFPVTDLALDVPGGRLYWSEAPPGRVRRARLDGSSIETLYDVPQATPYGLAVDVEGRKLYWTDSDANTLWRADLDGSNLEPIRNLATPFRVDVGSLARVGIATKTWGGAKQMFR